MDTTNSYLYTLLERIRTYIDLPEVEAKYSNDYLIRHVICPAQVDILSRLSHTTSCPVLLTMDLSMTDAAQDIKLPPNVLNVLRVETIDEDGNRLGEILPRSFWNPYGPQNWRVEGMPGALTLHVDAAPSGLETARVVYQTNGDVLPHYGTGTLGYERTTTATLTVTASGDTITRSSGSWATDGYELGDILDTTNFADSNNNLTNIQVTAVTDLVLTTTGTFGTTATESATVSANRGLVTLAASPTLGAVDRRENSYIGSVLRLLPASGPIEERQITEHYYSAGSWYVRARFPFEDITNGSVLYEIAPAGSQSLYEAIAAWSAVKIGTNFLSQAKRDAILLQYKASLKTLGDNLTYMQSRTPAAFERKTSDSEFYQPKILTIGTYV